MLTAGERISMGRAEKRQRIYRQVSRLLVGDSLEIDGGRLRVLCVQPVKSSQREFWLLERQDCIVRSRGTFAPDYDVCAVTGRRKRTLAVMCAMVTSRLLRVGVEPEQVLLVEGGANDAPLARPAWVRVL